MLRAKLPCHLYRLWLVSCSFLISRQLLSNISAFGPNFEQPEQTRRINEPPQPDKAYEHSLQDMDSKRLNCNQLQVWTNSCKCSKLGSYSLMGTQLAEYEPRSRWNPALTYRSGKWLSACNLVGGKHSGPRRYFIYSMHDLVIRVTLRAELPDAVR